MNNLPELPEDVCVIMVAKQKDGSLIRTHKLHHMRYIEEIIDLSKKEYPDNFKIYPMNAKIKFTKIDTDLAWADGLTLNEFKEYLND